MVDLSELKVNDTVKFNDGSNLKVRKGQEDVEVMHHVPSKGWVPEEKQKELGSHREPQGCDYFITYLCMKDGQGVCGSGVYRVMTTRLSAADITSIMRDLKERYKLDNLPTIITIYKLGVY